ncbi:hypothetical protein A3742_10145 [Oleiphilus sp. HI0071]|nr:MULTISPECIES: GGDEF domain-containing protein [unclassified Oleiphilus]KZY61357.1 hypothetical protein A3737_22035 [Oleiphilus sp. HI0065]KZY81021.1 hypothetical protein A3742_20165 [Oleiphilus sp. HI0071]KZZ06329.1 hypothetical protein A3744_00685 [Oleiphilus sp. HI0073]KZZ42923.1 hypothetical protein A3758_04955 [Oleiphilus sp. HI0118]KZZ53712.1 hypothetical protein A3760_09340 [Oleiphilus sp. HI0122]KZZ72098.1 hypothetical protein A3765_13450 [Oleiphilus sp. HI0130]KZZ78097.1 hypotheti
MTIIQNSSIRFANNFITRSLSLPALRALYGFSLAIVLPSGWILIQWLAGRSPFSEEAFDVLLYAYITVIGGIMFASIGFMIGKREQTMTDLALSDSLTGLYNKRYFQNRLDQEFERFQRYGTPMSLVQVDLDHFKYVNDTWGHQAGDIVLKQVANAVQSNLRTGEIAARVGGEELCIIVCNSKADAAFQLAERIRRAIKDMEIDWQGEKIQVSASFGIADAEPDILTKWQLYERADQALYQAKEHGRNLSIIFKSDMSKAA